LHTNLSAGVHVVRYEVGERVKNGRQTVAG